MITLSNYINGQLVPPASGNYIDNFDPSRGIVFSKVPDSDEKDVEAAVEAAKAAFDSWSTLGNEKRHDYLMKIVAAIETNLEKLAAAESLDNGKPVWLAREVDIPRAASNFKFFATAIMHFASESHYMENTAINYTLRRPIGVVGCISPWNLPLYLFTWKIAPALAAGNTVVAKPSEITPYTAFLLSEICAEILPPGVLNIVHGLGGKTGNAMVSHPAITAISFTGGTKTGEHIARIAAPMFKKLSLELGGKNPTVIFDDCNYDQALKNAVRSSFTNQGEICLCGSRIFVQKNIYEKFKSDFVQKVKELKVGNPNDDANYMGAIVSQLHLEKIEYYVDLALKEGGKILTGGHRVQPGGEFANGYYFEPTVIEGLAFDCKTNQEEIFGPVVSLTSFDTEAEVIQYANASVYGLAANVWTQDLTRAHRVAEQVKTGIVWVNCWLLRDLRTPFGGMKSSGVGREGGWEALRFFTEAKNVCIKLS
jgi:aminomuconate-semialdehyde/2-hydroxymuconate-6-semialdehyde dehydrogenase